MTPVLSSHSKIDKTKARKPFGIIMQVKSTAAILLTSIKLLLVLKNYFWSSFEWPLKTGFTDSKFLHPAQVSGQAKSNMSLLFPRWVHEKMQVSHWQHCATKLEISSVLMKLNFS